VAVAKQIAPPKVTGGGGFVFEDKVAAYFLACLLSGKPPLDPSLGLLSRVDFQTRVDGWFLDDLLLTLVFGGDPRRCALSVKSNQQFTADAAPREFVTLAWQQFLQEGTTHFRRECDLLGLVVTPLPPELAKELYELLSWAQMQAPESLPDRLTAPGFASELKRRLFRSFACPDELTARHGIRDTNIGELLRCIRVLSFDFEHDPSTRLQSAVQHCRSVLRSGALEEAVSLWERLLAIAHEHRPRAGYLDLPRLLEQVRSSFQLKDYPNYQADWTRLLARTRENLTIIPDKIGNAVSLPRKQELTALETAYSETRFVILLGPSGCGKTVIAKLWAEGKLQAHKVLWWNAGSFDVRDFATFEATLNLRYPLQELLETVPDPLAYTVIDGLDRVSGVAFQNLSVFLQRLRPNAEASPWRVLIMCQPEEWERIRTELARVNAPLAKWRVVEVKEPTAEELSPVWNAFPTLQHLALHPNLQTLLLKPKVLDLLAFKLALGGAVETREWVGESDLIQWFWDTEITKSPHGAMRSLFLMSLGEKQADDLHAETPLDTFALADLPPLDGLRQDRICKQHEERLSFSHDLYGDWARQRKLLQRADTIRLYLEPRLVSPLWHRAVRLYGLHLLEQDQDLIRWRAAMETLAAENTEGNLAQDLLLESVIFAAYPLRLLERLWPDLAANGGLFLRRLLGRFLHVATLPNPVITAVTKAISPDLETQAATLSRLPYWPYWLPMLQFLYSHQAEVIQLAPQHIAEITGTWLQHGHESWVLRQEAAELALALAEPILHSRQSGRFTYIEAKLVKSAYQAALAAAHELPERVAAFALEACVRREFPRQESSNETGAAALRRQTLLAVDIGASPISKYYAAPWPDGPHGPVDTDFRDIFLQENMLRSLIMTAPSVAREVLLALLIEPPRDDDPLWSSSRLDDNFEIAYMSPFYRRDPFLFFLHLNPTEGLEVILRLVNFATERWATRWVGQEPPAVTIPLPGGEVRWIGNRALYYWYRAYPHCPHPIAVALMALEKWLYDAIDAQQSMHELLNTLLQQSRSVAFAGLLSAVARKEPSLFEGILQPLLAVSEFHYWELRYSSQPDQDLLPIKGLHEWAHHLLLKAPQMRPFFEQARLQWIARLQAAEEGNEFKDYLEKLIAQYDIKNYEVQSHPEHGEMWVFSPPEALRLKSETFQKDTEEERLLLHLPIRCRQILDAGQPLQHDILEQFWDRLQHISQFPPPTDDDSEGDRVEDAICGGVAVLLKFHRQWLRQEPAREEWCVQQLLTTVRNPPKTGRQDHESAHVTRKWEQFCAQVLPLLWIDAPNSPDLRECIALLVTSHYSIVWQKFIGLSQRCPWASPVHISMWSKGS
jgi:hypothetical protein